MDILKTFKAIKTLVKEKFDTVFGLFFFIITGLVVTIYIFESVLQQLQINMLYASLALSLVIITGWAIHRRTPITENKFTIGIAPFNLLLLNTKVKLSPKAKRGLNKELVDYLYSALHFNKEELYLDDYIEIFRLPNRINVTPRNSNKMTKKLKTDLLIWGEAYYDDKYLHFKPKFEFLKEPANIYYSKFKEQLNKLESFKIKITDSIENQHTELSSMMHCLSFLGLMFQGIYLSHEKKFNQAKDCFDRALHLMHDKAFHNRSVSDIYLATRFFAAQNYRRWGSHILRTSPKDKQTLNLYAKGAQAFITRTQETEELKDSDEEEKLEHSLIYEVYLLTKKGDYKTAEEKLDSFKKKFGRETFYLYYLYKGLLQKSPSSAIPFFDKALKNSHNLKLCNEKIADYFFSKGKYPESIKYFKERIAPSKIQAYNMEFLEDRTHEKLSEAYIYEMRSVSAFKEKAIQILNKSKNTNSE